MTPDELPDAVLRCVRAAVADRELDVPVPDRGETTVRAVRRPAGAGDAASGDYASNVALRLARPAGRPAPEVAALLGRRLAREPGIARVEVGGPGFLNVTLERSAQAELVRRVLAAGARYGHAATAVRTGADQATEGARAGEGARATAAEPALPRLLPAPHLRARVAVEVLERLADAVGAVRTTRRTEEVRPLALREAPAPAPAPAAEPALAGAAAPDAGRPAAPAPAPRAESVTADPQDRALLARLGADELRWALLRPAASDRVRLPAGPVQREENPRFRVQYAHARVCALRCNARDLGLGAEPGDLATEGGWAAPARAAEGARAAASALCAALAEYPAVLVLAVRHRAPDRVVRHLEAIADAFLRWHDLCPPLPVGEHKPLAAHRARLALAEAAGTVLAGGLTLLGVHAPAHL